jgi:hypothetical protein
MKLAELIRAVGALAQTGGSRQHYEALAGEAENLANMVDWANGPIDPEGQWLSQLAALQDDLQHRYVQMSEPAMALLNGMLTRLGQAIAQHDSEFEAGKAGEDEGEDFI